MPDELLERIGHYLAVLDTKRAVRGTPLLEYLYVNRRLYRIFRPRWFKHLDLAFDQQGGKRDLVEKLLWAVDVHCFVRSAKVTLSKDEDEDEVIAVGVLFNLTTLEASIEPSSWTNGGWTPNTHHDTALARLASRFPHLKSFDSGQFTTTDDKFLRELRRVSLPRSLASFTARYYDNDVLTLPLPRVATLAIVPVKPGMNPPAVGLSWHTLASLSVLSAFSLVYNRWLAETLEIATRNGDAAIPLRRLELWATAYEQTAQAYLPDLGSIESILRLLTMSNLKMLQLKFGIVPTAAMEYIALPALENLDLRFDCNVLRKDSFLDLVGGLVKAVPHLTRLVVDAADLVCPSAEDALARLHLSAWDLARQHPQARALSLLAADSQIVDFRTWRIRGNVDAWTRWTRRSPSDTFAVDVWSFYEAPEDV